MEVRGERVVLRELRLDDAEAIAAGCADPDVGRFIPYVPVPYALPDAEAFLQRTVGSPEDDPERSFAITEPGDDTLLGIVTVRLFEDGPVGYWLAPAARGQGLVTDATRAVTHWAMEEHGIKRLTLTAHPDNLASQRVAEKAGFVRIGLVPHEPPFRDGTNVAVGFELT